jgi:hypothetical protein
MRKEFGKIFQEETKYSRDKMCPVFLDWSKKPEAYKKISGTY